LVTAEVIDLCASSSPIEELVSRLSGGTQHIDVHGAHGSSVALVVAIMSQRIDRTVCVVAPGPTESDAVAGDLETFLGPDLVAEFPSWGLLPFEEEAPATSVSARRVATLHRLLQSKIVVVATTRALREPTMPPDVLSAGVVTLSHGDVTDRDELVSRLVELGYDRVPLVEELGSFSVRGGIVDVFSPASDDPVRVEFDGDRIASLRVFVPATQRSTGRVDRASVIPRREVPIKPDRILSRLCRDGSPASRSYETLADLWIGDPDMPGATWYLRESGLGVSFMEHLPDDAVVVTLSPDRCRRSSDELDEEAAFLHERAERSGRVVLHAEKIFVPAGGIEKLAATLTNVRVHDLAAPEGSVDLGFGPPPPIAPGLDGVREGVGRLLEEGARVIVAADEEHSRRRIAGFLGDLVESVTLSDGAVSSGFVAPHPGLAVLTEHELLSRYRRRRRRRYAEGIAITHYSHLSPGDFVVHEDHGVARFVGLARIHAAGSEHECLDLSFAVDGRVYVPVEDFSRVSRYAGSDASPALSRLGGTAWIRRRARAKAAAYDIAADLARLYATRKEMPGFACPSDTTWQAELEASFPYEETPDQDTAITVVKGDLERGTPMDRLVCGDVGYGKTEIAVRAAFKVINAGRQVAVLVPTTVLSDQHWQTFRQRLSNFPVVIESLSRFRNPREQRQVIAGLKDGTVDVVVGTHRLLSKDVSFARLGLLVVDEEHRFGVTHKERIKRLRSQVDCLTLTATPIPRTLQMSLYGLRDFSVVRTPPKERLPVETRVHVFDEKLIVNAITRELERGGQVFFVHNRVQSIASMAAFLSRKLPDVRFLVAHGQMHESDLEAVMHEFITGGADVLVCSAIIESGLDMPNVNTIIINRADRFGIAQLYQLRGRVGRSRRLAHAYLLTPPTRLISPSSRKRLRAIEQHTALGSGYTLALRDLEIRGAGNILGREQSGFIEDVGYDLYMRMIEEAVAELRGEPMSSPPTVRVSLDSVAELPESYIDSSQERIVAYQQLADMRSSEALDGLVLSWRDRFGSLPEQARSLVGVTRVRIAASTVGVAEVAVRDGWAEWTYSKGFTVGRSHVEALRRATDGELELSSTTDGFRARLRLRGELVSQGLEFLARYFELVAEPIDAK
jgi:transcription-repair coupling factor (superfamily II helicase)